MSLRAKMKKAEKNNITLGQKKPDTMIKTGFDTLDYLNGCYDMNNNLHLGIDLGKLLMIIGKSGSGKTTLALQISNNILGRYMEYDPIGYIYEFERANLSDRAAKLADWYTSWEEFEETQIVKNQFIYTESISEITRELREIKIGSIVKSGQSLGTIKKINDEYLVTPAQGDAVGQEKVMIPTPIVIDSIPLMRPIDMGIKDDTLGSNMTAAVAAKKNSEMTKNIIPNCFDAGIIPIFINHIQQKINVSIFPTKSDLNYLKQDEVLPGGSVMRYLTNTLFKLDAGKKLKRDKEFGISGFIVNLIIVKSRTAPAGSSIPLVFDQVKGFDNVLSNYLYLKECGEIIGAGRSFYLKDFPDIKFAQKDFKDVYSENSEFRKIFNEILHDRLLEFVDRIDFADEYSHLPLVEIDGESFRYHQELDLYISKTSRDREFFFIEDDEKVFVNSIEDYTENYLVKE